MMKAFVCKRIFTGHTWLTDHAVITDDTTIKEIIPVNQLDPSIECREFSTGFLSPAFIDLQIYGASKRLFAVYPDTLSLDVLAKHNYHSGTAACLATVATNTIEVVRACIVAIRAYWQQGGKGILGLHLEGPWLNPVKKGAHVEECIHPPQMGEVKALLEEGRDVIRMITLAPEVCSIDILQYLRDNNIIISAGHSNATYTEAITGFENGITTVTHLYNAMSALHHREPGLTGAALDHSSVMASIIPDGFHVDYAALRIAKRLMGERLFAITDAVTETNEGFYRHHQAGDKYEANGVLSGSALTMIKAVHNLVNFAGVTLEESLKMCSVYPARLLGNEKEIIIEKGNNASISWISDDLSEAIVVL